jgi:hypothetical protein
MADVTSFDDSQVTWAETGPQASANDLSHFWADADVWTKYSWQTTQERQEQQRMAHQNNSTSTQKVMLTMIDPENSKQHAQSSKVHENKIKTAKCLRTMYSIDSKSSDESG